MKSLPQSSQGEMIALFDSRNGNLFHYYDYTSVITTEHSYNFYTIYAIFSN